jgi:predicted CoA-binding protein
MQKKKTVIVGASSNPGRYAQIAARMLKEYDHPIIPLGLSGGEVFGETILNIQQKPDLKEVDTITLYVSPKHQLGWYDYLISLNPKRIIFNPGTENPDLIEMAKAENIEPVIGCTLVMLRTNQY